MAIAHKTRTQLVVEIIREKILNGEIKSGQPLRQAALAAELNVSRIPIREALLQLEGEGLVNFEPHKGATATEISAEQVDELFELRAMLEAELLKCSIRNLDDSDFAEAEAILEELDANRDSTEEDSQGHANGLLNIQFHSLLYSKSNRPQTEEIVRGLNNNADRYVRMHLMLAGGFNTAVAEHRQILQYCRERNTEAACEYLQQHIRHAKDGIMKLLQEVD